MREKLLSLVIALAYLVGTVILFVSLLFNSMTKNDDRLSINAKAVESDLRGVLDGIAIATYRNKGDTDLHWDDIAPFVNLDELNFDRSNYILQNVSKPSGSVVITSGEAGELPGAPYGITRHGRITNG